MAHNLGSCTVQPYKSSAVSVTQDPHQGRKTLPGVPPTDFILQQHRESDGMDAHPALTLAVGLVDSVNFFDDRLNRISAKLIAEYIQADFFISGEKCLDGSRDSFDRAAVAE